MMLEAVDRAELAQRETALYDARAALADEAGFKKYAQQFKRVKRG